jgi:hypothetical protein
MIFYVPALSGLPRFTAQTLRAPQISFAEPLELLKVLQSQPMQESTYVPTECHERRHGPALR